MDPLHSKVARKLAGSASKAGAKGSARRKAGKKKKKTPGPSLKSKPKRAPPATTQNAGQSAAESPPILRTSSRPETERPAAREVELAPSQPKGGGGRCCGLCDRVLAWFGLERRRKVDDFVVFEDPAALERSLLWSDEGGRPTTDEYLQFVPEHERGLAEHAATAAFPQPPEDRYDY